MKDNRKPLSERIPKHVSERIHLDIGHASMCWEHPENAGIFDSKTAANIAFELCHFIADLSEEAKTKGRNKMCKPEIPVEEVE